MKRRALEGNFKKSVNLDAPKFTMNEVYEYKNIIENDCDTEDENETPLDSQNTRLPMHRLFSAEESEESEELRRIVDQLMLGNS